MLTPTDIHYVVGLLSELTHPDDVEVELGSWLFDQCSKTKRDVDVTIRMRDAQGVMTTFKAIEVKALRRKLGTDDVEQLIQKFTDIPMIGHKAIVSASGFSRPAIRKAQSHKVDLYELREWRSSDDEGEFGHIISPGVFTSYQWVPPVQVEINSPHQFSEAEKALIHSNPLVSFPDRDVVPKRLLEWLGDQKSIAAAELQKRIPCAGGKGVTTRRASMTLNIEGRVEVVGAKVKIEVHQIRFSGNFQQETYDLPSVFKGIYRVGEKTPVAGCCISELPNKSLMSVGITDDKQCQLGIVPLSDRNRRRIFRQNFDEMVAGGG